ncbi:hypothetical protein RND81_04G237800 [Saponaria officinalis]|uniref:Uncharacterized protein n=1 Tax=Saponaria officinalis TaxID=3572 RepID=A0AAW1LPC8_SAPOF
MSEGGVILPKEKLKTLAKLLQWQEQERIKRIRFRSERDRSDFLRCSQEAYKQTMAFLDEQIIFDRHVRSSDPDPDPDDPDPTPGNVVREYLGYLELVSSYGLQMVKGVHLRHEFLSKVREHADTLIPRIKELGDGSLELQEIQAKARDLIKEFAVFKEALFQSLVKKADPSFRNFSLAIKISGNSFEDLVFKYQMKLAKEVSPEFNKPFVLLDEEQKIEVYDEIIKSSGRGTYLSNTAYKVVDKVGKGLLIFTLAMSVWDIYSSEHRLQTALSEFTEFSASYVGGYVGEITGAAVATYLVTAMGVAETAVTTAFVGLAAFVSGFGLAIGLGFLAGYVVGKIFESGGKHAGGAITVNKDGPKPSPDPNNPYRTQVYAAPMPDGALLARQLAYNGTVAEAVVLTATTAAIAIV